MEIRARKGREGGVCSPDPKYQGRERTHPPQQSGDRQTGAGPKPGGRAAPRRHGTESACSARSRMLGPLVFFSKDCCQASECPDIVSTYIKVSTVTSTLRVGKDLHFTDSHHR